MPFTCPHPLCCKIFTQKCNLNRHVKEQHEERGQKFQCHKCGKNIYRLENLSQHQKTKSCIKGEKKQQQHGTGKILENSQVSSI